MKAAYYFYQSRLQLDMNQRFLGQNATVPTVTSPSSPLFETKMQFRISLMAVSYSSPQKSDFEASSLRSGNIKKPGQGLKSLVLECSHAVRHGKKAEGVKKDGKYVC